MNNTHCGLCRDMESPNIYRFIGGINCLNTSIITQEGVKVYNDKMNLLICDSGYILENDTCVPHCYSTCLRCILKIQIIKNV